MELSTAPPGERERPPRDGSGYLPLLAGRPALAIMRALDSGWVGRETLQSRTGLVPRTLERRLGDLAAKGIACRRRSRWDRRHVEWALTEAGLELLEVAERAMAAWESMPPGMRPDPTQLLEAIAGRVDRQILRELLDGPHPAATLLRRLPGLGRNVLRRRLDALIEVGLAREAPGSRPGARSFQLGPAAAYMARTAVLAARWSLRWTPARQLPMASDLPGLLALIAPWGRPPRQMSGSCLLRVLAPLGAVRSPDVGVSLAGGRIELPSLGLRPPDAVLRAAPLAWCEALLAGEAGAVEIEGDRALALALALLVALAEALAL